MGYPRRICSSALAPVLFCLVTLVSHPLVFAQSLDSERINRIRKQIDPVPDSSLADELDPLRDDISAAVMALTQRLDALERDNADLKAKVKSLEARVKSSPVSVQETPDAASQSEPVAQKPGGGNIRSGDMLTMLVDECVTGCTISELKTLRFVVKQAKPGSVITIAPGIYQQYKSLALEGVEGDEQSAPITIRAERLGDVRI